MPTPPPDPMKPPKSPEEMLARRGAVDIIRRLITGFYDYSYGTRTHMPAGLDCTDFMDSLNDVHRWAEARPDWTLEIVKQALPWIKLEKEKE